MNKREKLKELNAERGYYLTTRCLNCHKYCLGCPTDKILGKLLDEMKKIHEQISNDEEEQ